VSSKIVFLLAINVMLLVVGTVMDIFSAIVVVLPLIAPIAKHYGIDPYHLGVIFLLNLEVGYLHPPVGLNLFLTSVKFQRPITEVMWATIPFLLTMITALLVITYVPALTVVPEAERVSPINNLVVMVETGIDESKVSTPVLNLVDSLGNELKDAKGQPYTRKFIACKAITDETKRTVCQQLFFDVSDCKPDAKSTDPKQLACANKAIAAWTVSNLNEDAETTDNAIMTVKELPLVDTEGKPIEWDEPVLDAQGQPVLDPDTNEAKTEHKPLVNAKGQPVVKTLARCDKLTGVERDTCRELFAAASTCYIDPPDVTECIDEKLAACSGAAPAGTPEDAGSGSGSAAGSGSAEGSGSGSAAPASGDCKQDAVTACVKPAIADCVVEKISSWIEEYPDKAKLE
jgi:hypothetical protein